MDNGKNVRRRTDSRTTEDDFSCIDLWQLVSTHKETSGKTKALMEELFAVCTNEDFLESIKKARGTIKKETGFDLPTKDTEKIRSFRTYLHKNEKWTQYQHLLLNLRTQHNLHGEAYDYGDDFESSNFRYEIEDAIIRVRNCTKLTSDKEVEGEARRWVLEDIFDPVLRLSALESAICYNDPLYASELRGGSNHPDRGGHLKLKTDPRTGENFIEGKFYLHSSRGDIHDAIDVFYPFLAKKREQIYGVPNKKTYPLSDLTQQFLAFSLDRQGKNHEYIANKIDEYARGDETLTDKVRMILFRIKESNKRFDARTR